MSDLLPWLHEPLAQALAQAHGHATLVHGPQGVGQFEFSMALAQSWLCEAQAPGSPFKPACGACGSCHLISARSHPDLVVVVPEAMQANLGWTGAGEDDEGASEKSGKAKKVSQDIKVDAIRAVVQFSQQTASRGRAKVVVVHPAERMNMVSSNTLLKTLEEPPGMVRFVVSAGSLDELLPTVRSRCQAWRLPLPDQAASIAWLREQINGLSEADAGILLQASGGQPLTARDRHAVGLDAVRWPQIPRDVAQGQSGAMAGWPLPLVVETLQKLCHDLACMATGAPPRYFPEASLHRHGDLARLTAWSGELRKASRTAEHPWSLNLRVESLLQQARQALRFNK